MKSTLIASLIFITSCISVYAQNFSAELNTGVYADWFSSVSGQSDSVQTGTGDCYSLDVNVGYHLPSGFIASFIAGVQSERVGFVEKLSWTASPIYIKQYHNAVVALASGYSFPFGKSGFTGFATMGFGIGILQSENISRHWSSDDVYSWYEPQTQNSGVDTSHIVFNLDDISSKKVLAQGRASFGVEYRKEHLFFKIFSEMRVWFNDIAEMQYHIERMNTYYQYEHDYVVEGHFKVRGGYFGIGIGAGWYFGKVEDRIV